MMTILLTIPGIPAKIATRLVQVSSMSFTKSARRALEIATNTPNGTFISAPWHWSWISKVNKTCPNNHTHTYTLHTWPYTTHTITQESLISCRQSLGEQEAWKDDLKQNVFRFEVMLERLESCRTQWFIYEVTLEQQAILTKPKLTVVAAVT